jgi:hypothetical protein
VTSDYDSRRRTVLYKNVEGTEYIGVHANETHTCSLCVLGAWHSSRVASLMRSLSALRGVGSLLFLLGVTTSGYNGPRRHIAVPKGQMMKTFLGFLYVVSTVMPVAGQRWIARLPEALIMRQSYGVILILSL